MSALRVSVPGQPTRLVPLHVDPDLALTKRQRQVLTVVRSFGGNRLRAARELGVYVRTVQEICAAAARRGASVPPPHPQGWPKGRPNPRPGGHQIEPRPTRGRSGWSCARCRDRIVEVPSGGWVHVRGKYGDTGPSVRASSRYTSR